VVKDEEGRPLFRVSFRAKSVHLILPRQQITPAVLQQINEQLKRILGPAAERTLTAPRTGLVADVARAAPLRMLRAGRGAGAPAAEAAQDSEP
jgi:hypothetical protein